VSENVNLTFAISFNTEDLDNTESHKEDGNPNAYIEIGPKLDCNTSSSKFCPRCPDQSQVIFRLGWDGKINIPKGRTVSQPIYVKVSLTVW
jgi:hypothetical protein